jgi:acetyltransferase
MRLRPTWCRAGLAECLRLRDGRGVKIRPILPADLDALRAFFAALTPAARRMRFHVHVHELPADMLVRFSLVDQSSHVAFVAEPCGAAHPRLIGEARYIRGPRDECAELALVAAEAWCHVGLGSALTRALLRSARAGGVRRLYGDALAENVAILRLLRSFGARRVPTPDPEIVRLCVEIEGGERSGDVLQRSGVREGHLQLSAKFRDRRGNEPLG